MAVIYRALPCPTLALFMVWQCHPSHGCEQDKISFWWASRHLPLTIFEVSDFVCHEPAEQQRRWPCTQCSSKPPAASICVWGFHEKKKRWKTVFPMHHESEASDKTDSCFKVPSSLSKSASSIKVQWLLNHASTSSSYSSSSPQQATPQGAWMKTKHESCMDEEIAD